MKCEACAAIDREMRERVAQKRIMEDLAAAFAVVGILAWLDGIGYDTNEMTWALHRLGLYNGEHWHKLNAVERDSAIRLENDTLREWLHDSLRTIATTAQRAAQPWLGPIGAEPTITFHGSAEDLATDVAPFLKTPDQVDVFVARLMDLKR